MLGEGTIKGTKNGTLEYAVTVEKKYPYLWNTSASPPTWSTSKTVRNVEVMGSGGAASKITNQHNEFMTPAKGASIGPEFGIGWSLGGFTTEPVMTLKSCIGDRALGWDLLPPGSPRRTFSDASGNWTYAAYHETPHRWLTGSTPVGKPWAAGIQYDGDIYRANTVLGNLTTFYPGASCYEVAGFFWWQGDRDSRDMGDSTHYEANLVNLIKTLRVQYGSPNAKFVTASLGQTAQGDTGGGGLILDAMEAVANGTKYPEFKGNVAAVYSHPLSMGSSSGAHYGKNAETYMNVGQAMGMAMVGLLKGDSAQQ